MQNRSNPHEKKQSNYESCKSQEDIDTSVFYISRIRYFAQSIFLPFLFNVYSLEFLTFCPQEIMVFAWNIPFKNVCNYALQSLLVPHIANMCISMCISICVSAHVYQHMCISIYHHTNGSYHHTNELHVATKHPLANWPLIHPCWPLLILNERKKELQEYKKL